MCSFFTTFSGKQSTGCQVSFPFYSIR